MHRLVPMLPACNAVSDWKHRPAMDTALRATNAANHCSLHEARPEPRRCCCNCSHHRPEDRMRPCIAARAFHTPEACTDAPDASNACPLFDLIYRERCA
ncbi:hypothetical protein [Cupriavidus sp. AcVe19-6a]|uniref:hypothetical protein n=1 Tax=Cupriavidus sp. AcVe19-6a TaxID=2821358 RepID=UPI001AEB68EA|nr:hypothetical protein [Cupriavidus sp. AcVe19-6a]MBP0634246.1 hypothetical protein [Cupriavidus sp. AcVe19-6a]